MSLHALLTDLGSVLVVGGCDFVGRHFVSHILDCYTAQVSVLDLRTDQNRLSLVSYYTGDITPVDDVRSALKKVKPRIVFHAASPAFVNVAPVGDGAALYQ